MPTDDEKRNQDWLNRWDEGRIGFHLSRVNPLLEKYFSRLMDGGAPAHDASLFVPLCGKSVDMAFLHAKGLHVMGIELSEEALQEFFRESAIEHVRRDGHFRGPGIDLYAGDFFQRRLPSPANYIYDRAALIAMPPELHERYVEQLLKFAAPGARILLITLEYDRAAMQGPPFSVSPGRVRELFEPRFRVEHLEEVDALVRNEHFRARGLNALKEHCFLLT